jgi:hypothetical protein
MFPQWLRYPRMAMIATMTMMTVSCVRALGSTPTEDSLLRLVPANAEIVAGIQDPHHGDQSGRLLIVTHNNNVDLRDWITLVGVDDQQEVDRLVEVAMSSQHGGDLSEHLLLLRGWFNGPRILKAAEGNGGVATEYRGMRIVALKPFAREQREMPDTRWLAIVGDRTAVFGTPAIVKSALDRYVSSAAADSQLMKRLAELKADVNCWSVLTMRGAVLARHLRAGLLDDAGASLLRGVSNVAVGVHYGGKARVDFALSTEDGASAAALATAIGKQTQLLPIADTLSTHVEGVAVEQNEVRGSLRVKDKAFDAWLATVYARLSTGGGSGGENVARVGGAR